VRRLLETIKREYAKPLRERELAKRLGVNACYLRHLLKKATGVSFRRYLQLYRVAMGNEMMRQDPTLRIKALADALGYKHVSALDRAYHRCCGRSPSSVKKSLL
jgi:AraC-like DNA-binding protein